VAREVLYDNMRTVVSDRDQGEREGDLPQTANKTPERGPRTNATRLVGVNRKET